MEQKIIQAQALEARAGQARTLAEAQALAAQADRLRGHRHGALSGFAAQLIRN
ncbi:hypothetical protein [Sphingomonas sp.]|jgi:hypothetical protein|uniref:hypothetical protein n=1 Tax=Sphingomonas sp. TaxID=28214 RepID=UPI002EDA8CEF